MKTIIVLLFLVGALACQINSKVKPKLDSSSFIEKEEAKINEHAKALVKMGHMSTEFSKRGTEVAAILGQYSWHGDGSGYFGAYSFYPPAFEQAKRGWFLHGEVLEGSNELWPQDDWDTEKQGDEITFDKSVIGYKLPAMYMSWYEHGHYTDASFTATIVGISEDGHRALLNKRAPHHAEQWGMEIVPSDWVNTCACTNNFHPQFVDGNPVVEK